MKQKASRKCAATTPTISIMEKREFRMAGLRIMTNAVPESVAAVMTNSHWRNENWKEREINEFKILLELIDYSLTGTIHSTETGM